jgi:hypothetical protein
MIPAKTISIGLMLVLLVGVDASRARGQEPGEQAVGRGRFAGMQRVGGTVTAVSGANLTIKTEDGMTYQVVTTDNTRVMRGRGVSIKVSDLKPGDGVMAMGNLDAPNKTLHAAMVMAIDAEQMKKIEEQHKQELANLGKTLIAGRVTAIDMDNATMTVERPDGISQTIGFDEGTSFRRGRFNRYRGGAETDGGASSATAPAETGESITLADIKVGDRVAGPGAVKNGRFVPKELTVMTPGAGRHREGQQPGGSGAAGGAQPGTQPPR